jgi:hypothetical protein
MPKHAQVGLVFIVDYAGNLGAMLINQPPTVVCAVENGSKS